MMIWLPCSIVTMRRCAVLLTRRSGARSAQRVIGIWILIDLSCCLVVLVTVFNQGSKYELNLMFGLMRT